MDRPGWHANGRSFAFAVLLSLLWHFFWFFSVQVVVSPNKRAVKARPRIVSLGPVLDDSIFRTLVENKPQLSQTFYRRLSDFAELPEPPVRTVQRHEPGEVVSVPEGHRFLSAVRVLLGGDKATPEHDFFSRIKIGYREENPEMEGEVATRQVLSRPPLFAFPAYLDAVHRGSTVEIAFVVEPSGNVRDVETVVSSGNLELDTLWVRYVRDWQFAPVPQPRNQTGRVKLRFEAPDRSG